MLELRKEKVQRHAQRQRREIDYCESAGDDETTDKIVDEAISKFRSELEKALKLTQRTPKVKKSA